MATLSKTETTTGPSIIDNEEPVDDCPWFALRLLSARQMEIADALKAECLEVFVPMEYADVVNAKNRVRQVLRPVVRNLLFVKKTKSQKDTGGILKALPYKVSVVRKTPGSREYYEIPARQMFEFQAMCNPEILAKRYISEPHALPKAGTPVLVTHGPLKGLQGKLVRSNKHYFLLKEVPGLGVMLKVTRWCCKPLAEK